jgi:hypothetical protein
MSILIISDRESDLSRVLMESTECRRVDFAHAADEELTEYSAIAVLGGTKNCRPITMKAALREKIDAFTASGRPIFYEWLSSFAWTYTEGDDYTDGRDSGNDAMNRYIYLGESIGALSCGDLLDSQANRGCIYRYIPEGAIPVVYNGGHSLKHDHVDPSEINRDTIEKKDWRLWYYDPMQLVCSFRICDFIKARFAPFASWCGVIELILNHLGVKLKTLPKPLKMHLAVMPQTSVSSVQVLPLLTLIFISLSAMVEDSVN